MEQHNNSSKTKAAVVLWTFLVGLMSYNAHANDTSTNQVQLGSGVPSEGGVTNAPLVMDGMYHAPQYLPSHPTAATIWPRVVDVDCTNDGQVVKCDGYNWSPEMGRGEYIYIRPRFNKDPVPLAPVSPIVIYKEVPIKKGLE